MKSLATTLVDLNKRTAVLLAVGAASLLSACGGGEVSAPNLQAGQSLEAAVATGITTLALELPDLPVDVGAQQVRPLFHAAPVFLDAPDDVDSTNSQTSGLHSPRKQAVPEEFQGLSTRGLTLQGLEHNRRLRAPRLPVMAEAEAQASDAAITPLAPLAPIMPMATPSVVSVYTPAQIRAAYSLPPLPAAGTALTAVQAAQLGAGQTIYIVNAMHNPNVAAELTAFNQKFGLPACTTKAIASTASLPLAAASRSGCELSIVYSTASGGMTSNAPAYEVGWATETALDVQWAHATAPLARIVVIEAATASLNDMLGGIKLANAMGSGIVSMSFGANEGNYTASVDFVFGASNMTYLAATGDWGAAVMWPSVSPKVLAVGGTSLTYSGTGPRSEVSWSGTGGSTSLYTPTPSYQTSAVPGMGTLARRTVADVAFNADPSTGQYVATMAPGSTTIKWSSIGGTSLSTPQWAGLVAVANATRALSAKAALGLPHSILYGQIAAVPGTYASAFADITKGSNGACATCTAKAGYDALSGLGTPNVASLVSALSGATLPVTPPVVTPASISGTVGTALSFTASVTAPNTVTFSLSGAPSGMTVNAAGAVTWAAPVAGVYPVTVTAKDTKTGLSGQGLYTVTIAAAKAPTVGTSTITGKPGTPLSFTVSFTATNTLTYTLSGNPTGMSINSAGVVSWPKPVLGSYAVTVTAKDSKTGLSGKGIYTVKIATAGPVITAAPITGVAGKPVSGTISISAPGATYVSVSIAGAPMGMSFSMSGLSIKASWASPVLGNYSLAVTVVDSAGLTAKATMPITITAK